eukprot:tig00021244_g19566.t1
MQLADPDLIARGVNEYGEVIDLDSTSTRTEYPPEFTPANGIWYGVDEENGLKSNNADWKPSSFNIRYWRPYRVCTYSAVDTTSNLPNDGSKLAMRRSLIVCKIVRMPPQQDWTGSISPPTITSVGTGSATEQFTMPVGDDVDGQGYSKCEIKTFRKVDNFLEKTTDVLPTAPATSLAPSTTSAPVTITVTISGLLDYTMYYSTISCTTLSGKVVSSTANSADFVTLAVQPSVADLTVGTGGITASAAAQKASASVPFSVTNTGRDVNKGVALNANAAVRLFEGTSATGTPAATSASVTITSLSGSGTASFADLKCWTQYTAQAGATNLPQYNSQAGLTGAKAATFRTPAMTPSAPTATTSATANSATITYSPASGPITGGTAIQDKDGVSGQGYKSCSIVFNGGAATAGSATGGAQTYSSLLPDTSYSYTITCTNQGDLSSSVSGTVKTSPDAPNKPTITTSGVTTTATSITVPWTVADYDGIGASDALSYKSCTATATLDGVAVGSASDLNAAAPWTATIPNLTRYTTYSITVTCCNTADDATKTPRYCATSDPASFSTDSTAPGKVTDLSAYSTAADPEAAEVTFKPPAETGGPALTHCTITFTGPAPPSGHSTVVDKSWTVSAPLSSANVVKTAVPTDVVPLLAGTRNYGVKVTCTNGDSKTGDPETTQYDQWYKNPGAATQTKVEKVGDDSYATSRAVDVFFKTPTQPNAGGPGDANFDVASYKIDGGSAVSADADTEYKSTKTGAPGGNGSFKVVVYNDAGNSSAEATMTYDFPATKPQAPSPYCSGTASSSNDVDGTFEVCWNAPGTGGSAITKYKLKYSGGTPTVFNSQWIDVTPGTPTCYSPTGLQPNRTYTVQVVTVNSVGDSTTGSVSCSVPGNAPGGFEVVVTPRTAFCADVAWTLPADFRFKLNGVCVTPRPLLTSSANEISPAQT